MRYTDGTIALRPVLQPEGEILMESFIRELVVILWVERSIIKDGAGCLLRWIVTRVVATRKRDHDADLAHLAWAILGMTGQPRISDSDKAMSSNKGLTD